MSKSVPLKESSPKNGETSNSKMDLLKNIIFGENIKAYDTEFETIKSDIEAKKKELEALITEVKVDLDKMIDNLSTDINIRITELEEHLENQTEKLDTNKVDKQKLGELFITIGEKISQG